MVTVLGSLLILAAVMTAFTRTVITDSSNAFESGSFEISPNAQNVECTLWDTRIRRVLIDVSPATARIDFYLLDEEGIELLRQENQLQPVFSVQDVDGCDFTYQPPYRGVYAFAIQNRSNRTTAISERVISQGLEWDILQFSAVLAIIGAVIALIPQVIHTKHPQ
jgi:hypothetical protein